MSCKNLPPIPQASEAPKGSTYELNIGPYDRLIINVEHPEMPHIKTRSVISPMGITMDTDQNGVKFKTDFHIEHSHK